MCIRDRGFGGFFTGNGTHLADTASGYAADYIVGKIAALTDGRSVHMADVYKRQVYPGNRYAAARLFSVQ